MARYLVDVVNFNADASCLSSTEWLKILGGGPNSKLCKWLQLYVKHQKKVVLGFPGATIADIVQNNPEAIDLINQNENIFEIALRPFAHDLGLLRSSKGFLLNFEYGKKIIQKEFKNIANYFLPPEFMLTNEQLFLLHKSGVSGVFTNPSRYSKDMKERIPTRPHILNGIFESRINCIPFNEFITKHYLHSLQQFDVREWNESILEAEGEIIYSWRDGESLFFLPNGIEREEFWLKAEASYFSREHLNNQTKAVDFFKPPQLHDFKSYPVHSCLSWMREFRMLGFINRINLIENLIDKLNDDQIYSWLLSINSDIMSSIEKRSPVVSIKERVDSISLDMHTILRSERWFEGEEYLAILENSLSNDNFTPFISDRLEPHLIKWKQRVLYLKAINRSSGYPGVIQ